MSGAVSGARFARPWFPWPSPCPSTASAAVLPALFGGFVGTPGLSDFLFPPIIGLRPSAFPMRPMAPSSMGGERTSRFSRMECLRMRWGLRPRRAVQWLAFLPWGMLPSPQLDGVGALVGLISRLNTLGLRLPLSTLRRRSHGRLHMTRGHRRVAGPSMYDSFIRCSMPVYPSAPSVHGSSA